MLGSGDAEKSFFAKPELEHLGFWISCKGAHPVSSKATAVSNLAPLQTRKDLHHFIGMINCCRDMWWHRSELLAPPSVSTSTNIKWLWTDTEQKAFDSIKQAVSRNVLLTCPDFDVPFKIYTDASHVQLGAVITQRNLPGRHSSPLEALLASW